MSVNIIVAVGAYVDGYPIGKNGAIPWHYKEDLQWFKETTMGHPVIMGRKTWESLPKALTGRPNIVVTRQTNGTIDVREGDDVHCVGSVEEGIKMAKALDNDIFIIGGESIYKYALEHDLVDKIYVDYIAEEVPDADTFFPNLKQGEWGEEGECKEILKSKAYAVTKVKLRGKNNHVDEQYLKLVNEIIKHGEKKDTRAGKTHSLFSKQIRFNLKEGLPMLTTKKMFSKGVIHELLWFLKGDTNIKYLVDNGVHIWDDDAYRYYLELCKKENEYIKSMFIEHEDGTVDKIEPIEPFNKETFLEFVKTNTKREFIHMFRNETYTYGDLNNVYGYQWTKWGGHNQVQEVINTLKTNPDDRRMIISAWNVEDIPNMALPPCHFCCQFYTKKMTLEERHHKMYEMIPYLDTHTIMTDEEYDKIGVPSRKLSCVWHQRSVDSLLGLPFNIMSYSILTYMIAHCVNMDVDELIFDGGDVHVYDNQIETYKAEQKGRNAHMYALPKLRLNQDIKNIFDFKYEDIMIENYQSYPSVKYPLSVGL